MTAYKGKKNPHHVFITCKPHPDGIKNWLLMDFSGYFLWFSQFCCNAAPEETYKTLFQMTNHLTPGSLICADSYFGSMMAMERLVKSGKDCLFSYNKSCPVMLFKDWTSKDLKNGQSKSLWGEVEGADEVKILFVANSFQSEGKTLCTLSTVYSDELKKTELEVLIDDNIEEDQAQYTILEELQPEVQNKYNEIMGFVDQADQHILTLLSPHCKFHWSAAEKIW